MYFYKDHTRIHTYYARMRGHDHVWDRRYTQACTRDLCLCQLICKLVFASGAREPHSSFLSLTIFGPARLGPSTNTWDSFDPGSLFRLWKRDGIVNALSLFSDGRRRSGPACRSSFDLFGLKKRVCSVRPLFVLRFVRLRLVLGF